MFLTKECDYGVRVIRALADGTKKTVEVISQEEQIPKKYAYKIVKKLEKDGFLKSLRGRNGGYVLNKPLNTFTLASVVSTIDASRYINDCLKADYDCPFKEKAENPCKVHRELDRIQQLVLHELGSKTMEVMLQDELKKINEKRCRCGA